MLGVSETDRKAFGRYVTNNITDTTSASPFEMIGKVLNSFGLNKLLTGLINDRRRHPTGDLISALVEAEESGDRLSDEELLAMLFLLLFAGHETTASLLNAGTLALLQHPAQFEQLKANMGGIDVAIEELLRFTNPVQHIAVRYAREDITYEGTFIPKGGPVLISPASANRDETIFDRPDELDISRDPNRHVAFGFGIHYCLGAPLARIEARIGFAHLFERFPNMQLAVPVEKLKWRGGPALRGLRSLPIRLKG
jgi:cytochrome P450 PksS